MKVKKIEVQNLKAVMTAEIELNGKSVIVTAGNDKGKSTILQSLINRFRGEKPEIILKEGEKNGFYFMELTDGSRIEWKFTGKTEGFAYITKNGFKQTTAVLTGIGERYFGKKFDIDRFLMASPKEQMATLQRLVGLDFSEIDKKYSDLFEQRRIKNAELKALRMQALTKPDPVDDVNLKQFQDAIAEAKAENELRRKKWREQNEKHLAEIKAHNAKIEEQNRKYEEVIWAYKRLEELKDTAIAGAINWERAKKIKEAVKKEDPKPVNMLPEQEYIDTSKIEENLDKARAQKQLYNEYTEKVKRYEEWISQGKSVAGEITKLETDMAILNAEKQRQIEGARIPEEFAFDDNGLLYKGLPLAANQISSSAKYIAALKLGAMVLGEVKALHFDAGLLDRPNLEKVMKWAESNGIQLLIEKPDFDGGEIKYEII